MGNKLLLIEDVEGVGRSGDLLTRAIDDVDTLADLYLRTLLPFAVALGSAALGLILTGLIFPAGALALGVPLAIACTLPPVLTGGRSRTDYFLM